MRSLQYRSIEARKWRCYAAVAAGSAFLLVCRLVTAEEYQVYGQPASKELYDASVLVHQGNDLLNVNRNKEAADKFEAAVQMAPSLAEAHLDYGLALAKLSKADEALSELKIALNLKPDLDSAWLTMGALYQSSGRLADAIVAYRQFMARFPNNIAAPKIASLLQGLQKELDLSRPSGGVTAPDDYYAQITRLGVTRWPLSRMPIKIYVADGAGVPGFTPGFDKLVRQAFTDWAKVSNGLIKCQFVDQPKDADIECYWLADPQKLANAAEDGETRFRLNHEGMVHATMQLLTVPNMPEIPLTENRFRQISLHEVGHALGLNGHTADPRDAMYFSSTLEDKWRDLSQRDSNTITRLYGKSGV